MIELLEDNQERHRSNYPPIAVRPGDVLPFEGSAEVETEGGDKLVVESYLPPDLPFGYHTISIPGEAGPRMLIAAPVHCHLPGDAKVWGWATQLYSVRSKTSWGMGDLGDLEKLAEWSAGRLGARVMMVNPLGAVNPGHPVEASPYFPSSRCFRNPLYISLEALLEAAGAEGAARVDRSRLEQLRAQARELNSSRLIDREGVADLKNQALEILWESFDSEPDFEQFLRKQGKPLDDFAAYSAIAEVRKRPWTEWPESLRYPGAQGIAAFRRSHGDRIRFHQWTQWLVDRQLARAGRRIPLINDLPVGVNPAGFDCWAWSEAFATGFSAGAPPDEFNVQGQNWGIAPFDPAGLKAQSYEPFIRTIGAGLAHAGGLRIDHVMGVFRLFWVPRGADPSEGTYVSYPARELLDIIAIESRRYAAFVVGEDLGTVEQWMREQLAARSILSYRVLLFEPNIEAIPRLSLAAVTTHDLPTVAGLWTGADLEAQRKLKREPSEETVSHMRQVVASAAHASDRSGHREVTLGVHSSLARCPASIVTATLEDALGVEERPNMPGTVDGWPNWSLPLPVGLEELMRSEDVSRLAEAVGQGRLPGAAPGSEVGH